MMETMMRRANRLAQKLFGADADVRVTDSQAWVRKPDRHTAVAAKTVEDLVAQMEVQAGEKAVTKDMVTARQMSRIAHLHPSTITQDCFRGLVPGSFKSGKNWFLPKSAVEGLQQRHPLGGGRRGGYRGRRSPNGSATDASPGFLNNAKLAFASDEKVYDDIRRFVGKYGDLFDVTIKSFIVRACANELNRLRERGL